MRMEKLFCLFVIPLFVLGCERTSEGVRCRVWDQNMLKWFRDVEMMEINYLNHGVDLKQFPRLRKFVVREAVVSCEDIISGETIIIILNDQICQETQTQGSVSDPTTTSPALTTTTLTEIAALSFNKPWIYATGIVTSLLGLITIVLCIVCAHNYCRKPRRTINIELDSVSSITEFDSSVMREIKID
ncbi:uncharacterized protein LOC134258070 [Saccostrea cucullata]|uniref:uncharacterized protein LOC134258070 n=1 Tax=Saccostrea cuccullata TaxID=36930 RepID=UPI002ED06A5B